MRPLMWMQRCSMLYGILSLIGTSVAAEVFDARDEWFQSIQANPCTPDGKIWIFEYLGFWYENHQKCFRYILRTESQDEPCTDSDGLSFNTEFHVSLELPLTSTPCKNDMATYMTQLFQTPYPFLIFLNVQETKDALNLEFDAFSYYEWQQQYEADGGQIYSVCVSNFELGTTTFRGEATLISNSDHIDATFPDMEVPDVCSVFDYKLEKTVGESTIPNVGSSLDGRSELEVSGTSTGTVPVDSDQRYMGPPGALRTEIQWEDDYALNGNHGIDGLGERQNAMDFDDLLDAEKGNVVHSETSNPSEIGMKRHNAMTLEEYKKLMDDIDDDETDDEDEGEKPPFAPIRRVDAMTEQEWEDVLQQFWEQGGAERRKAVGPEEWKEIEDAYQGDGQKEEDHGHADPHHIKYPGRRLLG